MPEAVKLSLLNRALIRALPLILAAETGTAATETVSDAFKQGKISLNVRARYESVEQTGLKDSDAVTVRTRLGFATAPLNGFKAFLEGEAIVSPDGAAYNQAGINPSGAGRAVVADPVGAEINQGFVSYATKETTVTVGRQRVVFDNARFVGDVGWRQNMQTFDAITLTNNSVDGLTLNYAYIDKVRRVFGPKHPQGRWESDSHLINASYTGIKPVTITGYAYLLDFDNAAAQSCATAGVSVAGSAPVSDVTKLTYRAEYASQSDYGSSTLSYSADYIALEAGGAWKKGALALGYEKLGSDGGTSFRTPLATLHAFSGWADLFLTTPGNGLNDVYLKGSVSLPQGFNVLAFYHDFSAARLGTDYGKEFDAQVVRKFGKQFTALLKFARFRSDSALFPDVTKFWAQLEFAY